MKLAITLGDAAGISPEIILQALTTLLTPDFEHTLIIYGSEALLRSLGPQFDTSGLQDPRVTFAKLPPTYPTDDALIQAAQTPVANSTCGQAAYDSVVQATRDILAGKADALVTAPFNKAAIHLAGHDIPGHTELIAQLCQEHTQRPQSPTMAFYTPGLILSLVTIHHAISQIPSLITPQILTQTITRTTDAAAKLLHTPAPRIGVLALNPHAGEAGIFGKEELTTITPTLQALTPTTPATLHGPLVPDTAFTWMMQGKQPPYDAYVAMYHDQGLIPFKTYAFDTGVNMTLGLPIIRTSPDHGTAYDIARTGKASASSMVCAITCAIDLAK